MPVFSVKQAMPYIVGVAGGGFTHIIRDGGERRWRTTPRPPSPTFAAAAHLATVLGELATVEFINGFAEGDATAIARNIQHLTH